MISTEWHYMEKPKQRAALTISNIKILPRLLSSAGFSGGVPSAKAR